MSRNRTIYQSQALFIAPSSTGAQVSGTGLTEAPFGPTTNGSLEDGTSLLKKLDRVQNVNFNFTINRTDVNEFGKLARLDTLVTEAPTVSLDFSYYVTDGHNERLLGFNMDNSSSDPLTSPTAQAISGLLSDIQGNNYYILTVQDGEDIVGNNLLPSASNSVIAVGNGFISEYSFEAAVGGFPTASVSVEAFNIKTDASVGDGDGVITGNSPAVNLLDTPPSKFTDIEKAYKLAGPFSTGNSSVAAIRPGDIVLSLPSSQVGFSQISGADSAHIQSFSFSLPLSRTILQRLGNTFGFARVINVPINMEVSISAIVSELQDNNIFDKLVNAEKETLRITLKDQNGNDKISYEVRGAIFQSENYSSSIGDNQTVDMSYSLQLGGANDTENGLFMSGSYSPDSIVTEFFRFGTDKLN